MSKFGGGPAFPWGTDLTKWNHQGMNLRDYFAGQALPSVYDVVNTFMRDGQAIAGEKTLAQLCAEYAYEYADAMLAERDK